MDAIRRRAHRPVTAAAVLALAALATSATAAPLVQATRGSGEAAYLWRDPDGNPLPFQSDAEILEFLAEARIESVDDIELGVTNPRQVVLERDGVRMRAALRDYEETFEGRRFEGEYYRRLRDSYVFDVPAYQMSRILGLDHVPPVVFRRIGGERVSLQAWVEGGLMETDRIADDIQPPSLVEFRRQTQDMRVFDTLIGNVDRNSGNILYDENWKFWLIDHSRSFPRNDDTRYLEEISGISRWLYERIQELTLEELAARLSPPLTGSEVEWILARRDKVVAHIEALIVEKGGEGAVLFETGG